MAVVKYFEPFLPSTAIYTVITALKWALIHLLRTIFRRISQLVETRPIALTLVTVADTEIDIMYEFPSASNIVFTPCQSNPSKATVDRSLTAAKMLLQLREGYQVSQVALLDVISCCRFLCKQALCSFKADVISALGNSFEGALAHINLEGYDQFKNIDTNYLFEKYCIDNLGCLVSITLCSFYVYL